MADDFVKGLDPLLEELRGLPGNLEKGAMRTAVFRAAQFMRDEVKASAPVSDNVPPKGASVNEKYPPGTLKKSIKAKRGRGTREEVQAGVTAIFYAKWVEFGHVLKGHKPDKAVIGHVPPNPFAMRAFEANKERVVEIAREGLVEGIKKAIDRLRSRMPKVGS
jgi:HK97 gp10 family phage protein